MSEKMVNYTVMYDKGEDIDGKNVRPYETFRALPTPEFNEKVKKGWLVTNQTSTEKKISTRRR